MVLAALLISFQADPKGELLHLAERLEKLQRVSFEYHRVLDYGSNGFKHDLKMKVHVEFDPKSKPLGWRYQASSATVFETFNGNTYRYRAKGKEDIVQASPKADYFDHMSVMKNSLFGLARSLKAATQTEGISVSFDKGAGKFTFEWKGKELAVSQPSAPVEYWPVYEITVDPKLGLPSKIVQRLKDKKDSITTEFKSYDLNPPVVKWD